MNIERIFAVDKPLGISSQRAVQIVKYWARRKTGNKKIKVGHAGTLDPLASGVLVVGVGREQTKKLDTVVSSEKEYVADIKLGEISTTDDAEGQKTIINQKKKPRELEIKKVLEKFIGKIEQTPPVYSAIKIEGQEAYKRVRRGENIEMKKRKVYIKKIEIISYDYPQLKIRVICGKGTYIRSLAKDIGNMLATGAYLSNLVRTRIGHFTIEGAHSMKEFSMRIAVHASELDEERIDGTRVYIYELLKRFGNVASDDDFYIYHQREFNKRLAVPNKENYHIKILKHIPFWTQTRFGWDIFWKKPDVLWMPLHNVPFVRSKKTKIIITIHDLAFKFFPETFPKNDLYKLNFLTNYAIKKADHIIAVSKATKRDLLRFYPQLSAEKIIVVHHGINMCDWQKEVRGDIVKKVLIKYQINNCEYLIHIGTIQPRKNLITLISAFGKIKKTYADLKLVLVGGDGWMWQDIHKFAEQSEYASDIIFTKNISFTEVQIILSRAKIFIFPSLYEGFGIAGLEAMAAGVPVVAARNSSLPEVLGNVACYFDGKNSDDCKKVIMRVLEDSKLQENMKQKGLMRAQNFTWDKCAKKTLNVLRG